MSALKVYAVEVNGWPTTLQLTETDAAARGLTDEDTVEHRIAVRDWLAAEALENERIEAERLAAEALEAQRAAAKEATKEAAEKATAPANKSRTAANKGA